VHNGNLSHYLIDQPAILFRILAEPCMLFCVIAILATYEHQAHVGQRACANRIPAMADMDSVCTVAVRGCRTVPSQVPHVQFVALAMVYSFKSGDPVRLRLPRVCELFLKLIDYCIPVHTVESISVTLR
jgi:hypothetical protein